MKTKIEVGDLVRIVNTKSGHEANLGFEFFVHDIDDDGDIWSIDFPPKGGLCFYPEELEIIEDPERLQLKESLNEHEADVKKALELLDMHRLWIKWTNDGRTLDHEEYSKSMFNVYNNG